MKSKINLTIQGCDISNYHIGLFLFTSGTFTAEDTVFHKNAEGNYNSQSGAVATWNCENLNLTVRRCHVYVLHSQNSIVKGNATFSECFIDYGYRNWIFNNSTVTFNDCTFRNAGKGNNYFAGTVNFNRCNFFSALGGVGMYVLQPLIETST